MYYSVINRSTSPIFSFSCLKFIQIYVITVSQACHTHTPASFICHTVFFFGMLLYLPPECFISVAPNLHGQVQALYQSYHSLQPFLSLSSLLSICTANVIQTVTTPSVWEEVLKWNIIHTRTFQM